MPQLTFPLQGDELKVAVVVGLYRQALVDQLAAGLPSPPPLWTTGVIDTGSTVTCISADIIRRLGLPPAGQNTTQTASGSVSVRLFRVSLSIPPTGNLPDAMLTREDLIIMELADPIPDVEVLVGLDILLDCRLLLDGPGRQFTLDF
jgi:hypothetical protein